MQYLPLLLVLFYIASGQSQFFDTRETAHLAPEVHLRFQLVPKQLNYPARSVKRKSLNMQFNISPLRLLALGPNKANYFFSYKNWVEGVCIQKDVSSQGADTQWSVTQWPHAIYMDASSFKSNEMSHFHPQTEFQLVVKKKHWNFIHTSRTFIQRPFHTSCKLRIFDKTVIRGFQVRRSALTGNECMNCKNFFCCSWLEN